MQGLLGMQGMQNAGFTGYAKYAKYAYYEKRTVELILSLNYYTQTDYIYIVILHTIMGQCTKIQKG